MQPRSGFSPARDVSACGVPGLIPCHCCREGALPTLRDLNDFFWGSVCSLVKTLDDLGTTQHCGKGT